MKKIGIIIFVVLVICLLVKFIFFRKKVVEISEIKSFHFGYSTGMMVNAYVSYDIKYENNKYLAVIKPNDVAEEEALTIEIDTDDVKELEDILEKYEINKWDGFQKSDKNVLDGNSFSLYVRFINGDDINASGYMMYPKNYSNVRGELDSYFTNLSNS